MDEIEKLYQVWVKAHDTTRNTCWGMIVRKAATPGVRVGSEEWDEIMKATGAFKQAHGAEQVALQEYIAACVALEKSPHQTQAGE